MQPLSLFEDIIVDAPPTEGIKYAGSKLKLLPHILQLVKKVGAKTVLDGGITADAEFSAAKLETADFYFARLFPRTRTHAAAIRSGAAPLMTMPESHFDA